MSIWKETSKELVLKSIIFKIFKVGFKSQKSDKAGFFDVIETRDWINIVPVTKDNKVIMVKQFRFGSKEMTLEFPAGAMEAGENPLETAKRELLEETGGIGQVRASGTCKPNPAFLNNTCHHFIATEVEIKNEQSLDPLEEIELVQFPVSEIDGMIGNGQINHSLSIASWYFYKRLLIP